MDMNPGYDLAGVSLPDPPARIHMIGIGGVSVSGLARMLSRGGYQVSGSDMFPSPITEDLISEGIPVTLEHLPENVEGAALVVMTAAVRSDNPELIAAQEQGIPVVKVKALLGLIVERFDCLAAAGSHGKSTTSGMAALALERAGLDPSFAVGATVRELGTNARLGSGRQFVVEADEYDYSFLWLRPQVAIITNIEHDHPDIFPDLGAVLDAFERFAAGIKPGGTLVISAEDAGCQRLLDRLSGGHQPFSIVTFGEQIGDWRFVRSQDGAASVHGPGGQVFELRLAVPGRHNLLNALAVLASAEGLGLEAGQLVAGLEAFGGVSRRFEVLLDTSSLTVVNDYAHHPTEIVATIAAARERYPSRRVLAVFQPHTYSRTLALLAEFAAALDTADAVILADIYRARETDSLGVSSASIAERMTRPAVVAVSPQDAVELARAQAETGDVILVMGAGDIYRAAEVLAQFPPH
jgi:UDP-N-acetylmuramate--alanine ligase